LNRRNFIKSLLAVGLSLSIPKIGIKANEKIDKSINKHEDKKLNNDTTLGSITGSCS